MAVTAATAIAAAGAAGSIMSATGGGSEATQAAPTGFQSLPKEVQDVFLKTYLPAVETEFNKPQEAMPFERYYGVESDPFYNPQLHNLQNYSDQYGGLITDSGTQQGQAPVDNSAAQAQAMDDMKYEMIGRGIAGRASEGTMEGQMERGGVMSTEDYKYLAMQAELIKNEGGPSRSLDDLTAARNDLLGRLDQSSMNGHYRQFMGGVEARGAPAAPQARQPMSAQRSDPWARRVAGMSPDDLSKMSSGLMGG